MREAGVQPYVEGSNTTSEDDVLGAQTGNPRTSSRIQRSKSTKGQRQVRPKAYSGDKKGITYALLTHGRVCKKTEAVELVHPKKVDQVFISETGFLLCHPQKCSHFPLKLILSS